MSQPTTDKSKSTKPAKLKANNYPWYSPRIWQGMRLIAFLKLLAKNNFAIHPFRIPMAWIALNISLFNSVMYFLQQLIYGKRAKEVELKQPMVFILGHWRSGTTYLHELMSLDDRFTSPSTIQCFAPCYFMTLGPLISRWFGFMMPSQRPMDNMKMGWSRPQEDEFALCSLGIPSPYTRIAFPNRGSVNMEYLDMQGLSEQELATWKTGLDNFIRLITIQENKPMILKSPTHTGRLKVLAEMYPDARFVHISRNPYEVYSSTLRLWHTMDEVQGMQITKKDHDYGPYVFECMERMYQGHAEGEQHVNQDRICQTSYEDLVKDPLGEIQRIYQQLDLGDFDNIREPLEETTAQSKSYKANQHSLDDATREQVETRWSFYFEKYGYEKESGQSSS
ncbi:MAG: sulfotransferase family protein [Pirellulales bacterium]